MRIANNKFHFRRSKFSRVFYVLEGPFAPALQEAIKVFPGVHWGPSQKRDFGWLVPVEIVEEVAAVAKELLGYEPKVVDPRPAFSPPDEKALTQARRWQREYVGFSDHWGGGGAWFEQGLGKSLAVLLARIGKTLIVTPPGTINTMMKQIDQWCSEEAKGATWRFDTATKKIWPPADFSLEILVTTYTLLSDDRILEPSNRWQTIIFDEAHHVKNYKSARSREARKLRAAFPNARVLLATGTPQGEGFHEWFNYADLIWPGRFGTPGKFLDRYVARERIEGLEDEDPRRKIVGLKRGMEAEFRKRVAALGIRAVKEEIKDELPPLDVQAHWIPSPPLSAQKIIAKLKSESPDDQAFKQHMKLASSHKVTPTLEALADLMEQGEKKIFVGGWFKGFADVIAAGARELAKDYGYEVFVTHSGLPDREGVIAAANTSERAVLISTIANVKEGRNDLAQWPSVICGEVHYSPIVMSQFFARFHRVGTLLPVIIKVMLLQDSLDDRIIELMSGKVEEQNKVIALGAFEQKWKEEILDKGGLAQQSNWQETLAGVANEFANLSDDEEGWNNT